MDSVNLTERLKETVRKCKEEAKRANNEIRCPHCRSTQLSANTKGFGLGKAAAGGLLLGPVGLLGGVVGSKKVMITCLKCGKQWEAGSKPVAENRRTAAEVGAAELNQFLIILFIVGWLVISLMK